VAKACLLDLLGDLARRLGLDPAHHRLALLEALAAERCQQRAPALARQALRVAGLDAG
jgi:hypothetical protein